MRRIQEADVKNKKILVRVDFNVAIEDGKICDEYRIKSARETIHYLRMREAKVAMVAHFGRPDGKRSEDLSFERIYKEIEKILGISIVFIDDCIDEGISKKLDDLKSSEIILLENTRFYAGEEDNDSLFAKSLAEPFEVFINDAFSVCHRDQASVTGVAKILPSYAGFWLQKEIENLDKIRNNPKHPAVAIIGGAKIETKLPLIAKFEDEYDYILVGGKIANEAIDQKIEFPETILLPEDFGGKRLDIGPKTVEKYSEIISKAKTVVWNGPMGKFEERPYDNGTKEILKAVIKSGAFVLMGGGESLQILEENKAMEKISFVSTGGGAMLEYLGGNILPGIEILQ